MANKNGHWYTDRNGHHYFVEDGQSPKEGWEASKRRKMIDGGKYKVSEDGSNWEDVDEEKYKAFESDESEFDENIEDDFGFDEDEEYNREMEKAQEENAEESMSAEDNPEDDKVKIGAKEMTKDEWKDWYHKLDDNNRDMGKEFLLNHASEFNMSEKELGEFLEDSDDTIRKKLSDLDVEYSNTEDKERKKQIVDEIEDLKGKLYKTDDDGLEDAIKNADDDVLDEQFGKDTPERKLAGAMKDLGTPEDFAKKTAIMPNGKEMSLFDFAHNIVNYLDTDTAAYIIATKFGVSENDAKAYLETPYNREGSKEDYERKLKDSEPDELKEFSFYGQPVNVDSNGMHGTEEKGMDSGRNTKKYKAKNLEEALEMLKKDYPNGFGVKYHEGPEGRVTHGQYKEDWKSIDDLLNELRKGKK